MLGNRTKIGFQNKMATLIATMQAREAQQAINVLFNASPEELGNATVRRAARDSTTKTIENDDTHVRK